MFKSTCTAALIAESSGIPRHKREEISTRVSSPVAQGILLLGSNFAQSLAVGRAAYPNPNRQTGTVPGKPDHSRTSRQKYFPPNWAPIPRFWVRSKDLYAPYPDNGWHAQRGFPGSGQPIRETGHWLSLTVFRFASAEVPPITTAKW